jgi:predicted DNA-binding protein
MKIKDLLERWERQAAEPVTVREYSIKLPLHTAARLLALTDMYPGRTKAQIITDLLETAVDELEAALPYVQGTRVVAEDELGDAIYEDVGPTPHFNELTRKHARRLRAEIEEAAESED